MTDITERQTGSASLATVASVQKILGVPADGQIWVTNKDGSDAIILDDVSQIDANIDSDAGRNIVILGRGGYAPFRVTSICFIAGQQGGTYIVGKDTFLLSDEETEIVANFSSDASCDAMGINFVHTSDDDVVADEFVVHNESGNCFFSNCEITTTATIDTGSVDLMGGSASIFAQNCEWGFGSSGAKIDGSSVQLIAGVCAASELGDGVKGSGVYIGNPATIGTATGMFFNDDDMIYSNGTTTFSLKALLTA